MSYEADTYDQRDSGRGRDASPRRRSRSPRRARRSYSPRSRSRSRDDYRRGERRSRSPVVGAQGAAGGYQSYGAGRGGSQRPAEGSVGKEGMMQNIRESSQQDRRVYVGNLSYDVKWHHLKDFMRQGMEAHGQLRQRAPLTVPQPARSYSQTYCYFRMECQRDVALWSMQLGSRLRTPCRRSAIRT
ncbi:hypothetical protein K504DRAFT_226719 [Pleomassaria siparia CBS 279.74]|uniref:RRM domain-containing protein n=1 Tax=Pleomassaria siparia CBS 279.74 TaxID=1314801 RepID=A0A6G1KFR0_9PLEO|nr:hypothetical protein K504DRAFT_226719 [Pleomassaria siparia CBS 279.74]